MMNLIIGYLLIGVIFTIVLTVGKMIVCGFLSVFESTGEMLIHSFISVLIWPIDLVWSIQGFIEGCKIAREFLSKKESGD